MIQSIIDEYIAQKRADNIRSHDRFRVSDAGRCHLMRYWKRQGKPFTDLPDDRTSRVFEVGHVFHRWLQDVLRFKGMLMAKEVEVADAHRIGHIDAIVRFENGFRVLYDFKTVHSRKFHHRRKEGGNSDLHYAMQAWTYYMMFKDRLDEVRIAYISKDDLCIEEVVVSNVEEMVRKDWEALIDAWVIQEEPEPNPMEWECKYCVYRTGCQYAKGYNKEVQDES